jgi:hypothetical protein
LELQIEQLAFRLYAKAYNFDSKVNLVASRIEIGLVECRLLD